MGSGAARFSGGKQIVVPDIDRDVRNALLRALPALFESEEDQKSRAHQQREEHADYAGTLAEIQGAVWIAARVVRAYQGTNSATDTKKEIEAIANGNFIPRLESALNQINLRQISDETWWALVESSNHIPLTPAEFVASAKVAQQTPIKNITEKPRPQEIYHWAASEMTRRIVKTLAEHSETLGIALVGYSYNQERPTKIVELLRTLGEIAGVFLGHGTWRNHLASAKK